MQLRNKTLRALLVLSLALAAACDSGPVPTDITILPRALSFDAVGDSETLEARVFDEEGIELEGATVEWSSSNPAVATVNASGEVTSVGPGTATLQATAGEATGTASASVQILVTELSALTPTTREGIAGTTFAEPLRVEARDRLGAPTPGATINASVISGDGALGETTLVTGPNGQAETTWTLGPTAGELQQVRLRAENSPAQVFFLSTTVAGPPAELALLQGGGQVGLVNAELPVELRLAVTDAAGNAITASPVSFAVTAGNGSVASAELSPNSEGEVSNTWTLGPDAGTQTVTVTAADLTTVISATALTEPAGLALVGSASVSGTVGEAVPDPIQIEIVDAGSVGIPGVPIRFTPDAGSGVVRNGAQEELPTVVVTSDAQGVATLPAWVLGTVSGDQTLVASFPGLPDVVITAEAGAGPVASIEPESGNFQTAVASEALADPVVFLLADEFGNAVAGEEVTFAPSGSGSTALAVVTSDAEGRASNTWTLDATIGLQTLEVSTADGGTGASYAAGLRPVTGDYSIETIFRSEVAPGIWAAFQLAANRWSELITGDLPDVALDLPAGACGEGSPAIQQTVDDLAIFAVVEPIDGDFNILGSAGPCQIRSGSRLPVLGRMRFDVADLERIEQGGTLIDLILHEMGHVLGIGTLWSSAGLLVNPSTAGGAVRDTHFNGALTIAAFDQVGGDSYTGGEKVPVENTGGGGTVNGHWRESVFDTELMTGFLDSRPGVNPQNPLSIVTTASLGDLGYVIDDTPSDGYTLPSTAPVSAQQSAQGSGTRIELVDDIWRLPIQVVPDSWIIRR
jgi:hypothetical protein